MPLPMKNPDANAEPSWCWSVKTGSSRELLDLLPLGNDRWAGASPEYPWGWVYGGRIAAQALRAAQLSCDDRLHPSTLHCTFLKPARCGLPREHQVERLADTRSRAARSVEVTQDGIAVAHVSATFDAVPEAGENGIRNLEPSPAEALKALERGDFCGPALSVGMFERRLLELSPQQATALITLDRPPDSANDAACMIAYAADDLPTDAARAIYSKESYLEGEGTRLWSMTTTYAIHFCSCLPGRKLLFHTRTKAVLDSRASIEGVVVDASSGRVAAVCMQQVMIRRRRNPASRTYAETPADPSKKQTGETR